MEETGIKPCAYGNRRTTCAGKGNRINKENNSASDFETGPCEWLME